MYIRGLMPRNFAKLAEAVPIAMDAPNDIQVQSALWLLRKYA